MMLQNEDTLIAEDDGFTSSLATEDLLLHGLVEQYITRAVPAVDNTPVTTGNEPLAANAMTAPAAAPVTPLENVLS